MPTNEEERKTKEKKEISCLSLKEISFMSSKDTENSLDKISETLTHMEGRLGKLKDEKVELDACYHDFR